MHITFLNLQQKSDRNSVYDEEFVNCLKGLYQDVQDSNLEKESTFSKKKYINKQNFDLTILAKFIY